MMKASLSESARLRLDQSGARRASERPGPPLILTWPPLHPTATPIAESSGAAALAAVVQEPARFAGQTVGTVICGGNLTPAQMRDWLGEPV